MPSLFRKLPLELRGPLFKEALQWKNGKAPALLAALRTDASDRELYEEALDWIATTQTFILRNEWGFRDMSEKAINGIEKLRIECV